MYGVRSIFTLLMVASGAGGLVLDLDVDGLSLPDSESLVPHSEGPVCLFFSLRRSKEGMGLSSSPFSCLS